MMDFHVQYHSPALSQQPDTAEEEEASPNPAPSYDLPVSSSQGIYVIVL